MAINVNTVYQTVLAILNKEQRGYLTPAEFNKVASQSQLEIFEKYFEDLNQQIRVPQADVDYSDRVVNLDEKIAIFKTFGNATYDNTTNPGLAYFILPTTDAYNDPVDFYRLGTVIYTNDRGKKIEVQRISRTDFYNTQLSSLTEASKTFPVYLYENRGNIIPAGDPLNTNLQNVLYIEPSSIQNNIKVDFIRKPKDVVWGFTTGPSGQYIFDDSQFNPANGLGSNNFELHESEQTNVTLRILAYAGVIIEDPGIVQVASQTTAGVEGNKKS